MLCYAIKIGQNTHKNIYWFTVYMHLSWRIIIGTIQCINMHEMYAILADRFVHGFGLLSACSLLWLRGIFSISYGRGGFRRGRGCPSIFQPCTNEVEKVWNSPYMSPSVCDSESIIVWYSETTVYILGASINRSSCQMRKMCEVL